MRLIDVDNFKQFLHNLQDAGAEHVDFDDLHKFLDEQPTTYDVEHVVEKLEKLPQYKPNLADAMLQIQKFGKTSPLIRLDSAIEIVKCGVI